MSSLRRWGFLYCAGLTLLSPSLAEEPAADAEKLWNAFLEIYTKESYHSLKAEELDQSARLALLGTLKKDQATALYPGQTTLPALVKKAADLTQEDAFDLTELAIQRVMPLVDRYGSYETSREILAQQDAAESPEKKGVFAIRLVLDPQGKMRCYPDPDGPAAKAGLPSGALLIKANTIAIEGKSLSAVREIFSQKDTVELTYLPVDGTEKSITVPSTHETFSDVQVYATGAAVRLRVRHFSEGSAALIQSEMSKYPELQELTLDLRGNDGGLLQEALITCALFLPRGAIISYDIVDGKKVRKRDDNDISIHAKSIIVQMDGATASGAELLITCLKYHFKDQVKLCGSTSYGKHFRTVRTQLLDAGMLTITDGIILGPDGDTWPDTGITPDP